MEFDTLLSYFILSASFLAIGALLRAVHKFINSKYTGLREIADQSSYATTVLGLFMLVMVSCTAIAMLASVL